MPQISSDLPDHRGREGFTTLELMIVVTIIGILAAIAIPAFDTIRQRSRISTFTNDLRIYDQAFSTYELENENTFPPNQPTDGVIPVGMEGMLSDEWKNSRPIGGTYSWVYDVDPDPDATRAYIRINNSTSKPILLDSRELEEIDEKIDDGNTGTGRLTYTGTTIRYFMRGGSS